MCVFWAAPQAPASEASAQGKEEKRPRTGGDDAEGAAPAPAPAVLPGAKKETDIYGDFDEDEGDIFDL